MAQLAPLKKLGGCQSCMGHIFIYCKRSERPNGSIDLALLSSAQFGQIYMHTPHSAVLTGRERRAGRGEGGCDGPLKFDGTPSQLAQQAAGYEAGHLVFAATCTCDPVCQHLTPSSERAV